MTKSLNIMQFFHRCTYLNDNKPLEYIPNCEDEYNNIWIF